MKIKTKVGLHNEFRLERRKALFHDDGTWSLGELVQEVFGYNLILNQGLNTAAYSFRTGDSTSRTTQRFMRQTGTFYTTPDFRFGGSVNVGNGTGTLDPARTTLFSSLGHFPTEFHEREVGDDWASYTQVYTIQPEELVGDDITEVALGATNNLRTHALLEDSEGNPISILNKTETEVVVIYAKVFMDVSSYSPTVNVETTKGEDNALLAMVYNNNQAATHANYGLSFGVGSNGTPLGSDTLAGVAGAVRTELLRLNTASGTSLDGNKVIFYTRLGTSILVGEKIKEVGYSRGVIGAEFGPTLTASNRPVFRAILPSGSFNGHTLTDELIGTGDGTATVFTAAWDEWNLNAVTVKVNNVTVTTGFTIDRAAGTITFDSPVTNGHEVKATYSVDYIPKDDQHVLDISWEWHFTDANAV